MSYLHFCLAHTFSPFRSRDLNNNSPYCMSATHFLLCQLKDQMISHSWYVLLFLITLLHNSVLILKAQISFKSHYHFGELNFQPWRISFLLSSLKTSSCRITTTFPAGLKEINIENKSQESISEDYNRLGEKAWSASEVTEIHFYLSDIQKLKLSHRVLTKPSGIQPHLSNDFKIVYLIVVN